MSLYFICGKVGAGKTYRGVENIRDELLRTERLVVTNLPLLVDNLKAYFEKHHPERVPCFFDHWREALPTDYLPDGSFRPGVVSKVVEGSPMVFVPSRIRFLADDQLAEFYRYRHALCEPVRRIPEAERNGGKSNPLCLDFGNWLKGGAYEGQGVAYHLDEGQLFYNARRYADVTPFDPGVGVKVPVKVTVGLAVGVEVGVADGVEVGVTVGVSVGAFWQTPPAP